MALCYPNGKDNHPKDIVVKGLLSCYNFKQQRYEGDLVMKRFFVIAFIIVLMLSVVSCGNNRRGDNTSTVRKHPLSTQIQSTKHEFTDTKFPESWNKDNDDGAVTYTGSQWPNNELSDNLPKPEFGDHMQMVARFTSNEVMFVVNLSNVNKEQLKEYMNVLKAFGYLNVQIENSEENSMSFSGKHSNKMELYCYLNDAGSLMIQINKNY